MILPLHKQLVARCFPRQRSRFRPRRLFTSALAHLTYRLDAHLGERLKHWRVWGAGPRVGGGCQPAFHTVARDYQPYLFVDLE